MYLTRDFVIAISDLVNTPHLHGPFDPDVVKGRFRFLGVALLPIHGCLLMPSVLEWSLTTPHFEALRSDSFGYEQ
jgi:hypothetical protein